MSAVEGRVEGVRVVAVLVGARIESASSHEGPLAAHGHLEQAGGGQPPEFLSTHPSHGTRIQDLEARMPQALELQQQAKARGRNPRCS